MVFEKLFYFEVKKHTTSFDCDIEGENFLLCYDVGVKRSFAPN